MPTVSITADSQIRAGRVHTKRRTSRTTLPFKARRLVGMNFQADRGPESIQVVGSPKRFEELYGGYASGVGKGWLAIQDKVIFPLACRRAVAAGAVAASKTLQNAVPTTIATATANSKGTWANAGTYDIANSTDGDATKWKFVWHDPSGKDWTHDGLNTQAGQDNLATVQGSDPALPVVLTKNADGRPINVTGATLSTVAGADGSIADTDFTGTGKGLEQLASYNDTTYGVVRAVFVAERSSATIRAKLNTLAGLKSDRVFLMCPDSSSVTASSARTDVASYRNELVRYVWNHPIITNPSTGLRTTVEPCSFRAALIACTDPQVHAAFAANTPMLSGAIDLTFPEAATEPSGGGDLDLNNDAGITSLWKSPSGVKFFTDVTTSVTGEKSGAAVMIDIELLSLAAARLEPYLFDVGTPVNEDGAQGAVFDVLEESFRKGTGVSYWVGDDGVADKTKPGAEVDIDSVNDEATREADEFHLLMRYRRLNHWTAIVLEQQAGRGLTFRRAA